MTGLNIYQFVRTRELSGVDLLCGQGVDVSDLPGHGHGVAVDDVEVLLPEQQQTLTGVQTLHPGTAVHVLDLNTQHAHTHPNKLYIHRGVTTYLMAIRYTSKYMVDDNILVHAWQSMQVF